MDGGGFYLSDTPDQWSAGWGANLVRAANWVKLRCVQTGIVFIHLNTHLDHESELARVNGSRLILERLDLLHGGTLPVIVTADFNALPGSESHRAYLEHGYRDTFTENGARAMVNTFHGFQGPAFEGAGVRIDWILVSDGAAQRFTTRSCEVIMDAGPPIYPSDHYPVLAELDLCATRGA